MGVRRNPMASRERYEIVKLPEALASRLERWVFCQQVVPPKLQDSQNDSKRRIVIHPMQEFSFITQCSQGHGGPKGQRKHPLDIVWKNLAKRKAGRCTERYRERISNPVFSAPCARSQNLPEKYIEYAPSPNSLESCEKRASGQSVATRMQTSMIALRNGFLFALKPEKIKKHIR